MGGGTGADKDIWSKGGQYRLSNFEITHRGRARGDWVVFGQITNPDIVPPRFRVVLARPAKHDDWFDLDRDEHVTVERMEDGSRIVSDTRLYNEIASRTQGVVDTLIDAVSATGSFLVKAGDIRGYNRGVKEGFERGHAKGVLDEKQRADQERLAKGEATRRVMNMPPEERAALMDRAAQSHAERVGRREDRQAGEEASQER